MTSATIPFWPGKPTRIWPGGVYNQVITSPDWVVEPKLDGWRCLVEYIADGVRAWTRHGNVQRLDAAAKAKLESLGLPEGTVLDGELLGPRQAGAPQKFVAFDAPSLDRDATYAERRAWLESVPGLDLVPHLPSMAGSFIIALTEGHEGIVIKQRKSRYPYALGATGNETSHWLKVKP